MPPAPKPKTNLNPNPNVPEKTMFKKILRNIAQSNARRAAKFLRDNNFNT